MKKSTLLVFVVGVLAGSLFGFQNCGEFRPLEVPDWHPSVLPSAVDVQDAQILVLDKDGVESALSNVFLTDAASEAQRANFQRILDVEIYQNQHLFGRPCNPYESGGQLVCNASPSNALFSLGGQTSTGREAARIHACRLLVSNDEFLNTAVQRTTSLASTQNSSTHAAAIRLFYPALAEVDIANLTRELGKIDQSLITGGESVLNRWRLLFLILCESPEWQAL